MPLIIIAGYPSSGKTTRCKEIKEYFIQNHNKTVYVVSEDDVMTQCAVDKNTLCFDSKKQKEIRSVLKNNAVRLLGSDVVLLDASNNIKGFRYELYCAAKCHKTTHCVIECDISREKAWELNESRQNKYTRDAFDALITLYEPPHYANRWDSPLITVQLDDKVPGEIIYHTLFERKAPPPNQSTQNFPSCSSTYLSDLDKIIKELINTISQLQADGVCGRDITLPNVDLKLAVLDDSINTRNLANLKRQFISLHKLNPLNHSQDNIARLFVQFINSSLLDG